MNRLYFLAVVFAATIILVTQLFMAYVGENGGFSTFETLVTGLLFVVHTYCFIERLQNYGSMMMRISGVAKVPGEGGGGSNPIFAHGKNVSFPIFSHFSPWEKMGKKYMEREGNEYSSHILFPIFPYGERWEKMGKDTFFPWAKMGLDHPSVCRPGWTDPRRLPA